MSAHLPTNTPTFSTLAADHNPAPASTRRHARRERAGTRHCAPLLSLLLLLLLLTAGCGGGSGDPVPTFVPPTPRPTQAAQAEGRSTAVVTRGTITPVIEAPGQIEALRQEDLYFETSGIVREVHKEQGEAVTAGEPIAALNTYSLEQTVLQRGSDLRIAELTLAQVETRAAGQELSATSPISFELAIARERASLAQALYDLAVAQLEQAVVRAPFDGVLTSFNRQRGSRVEAYDTVGVVADMSELRIVAYVPADAMAKAGGDIAVGAAATLALARQPGLKFRATVSAVETEPVIHEGIWAHEVTLTWAPDERAADLPPTVPLEVMVEIEDHPRTDVLLVPAAAVTTFAGQSSVEVVQDDGTLRTVPVIVGVTAGTQAEIRDGLEVGQRVIVP